MTNAKKIISLFFLSLIVAGPVMADLKIPDSINLAYTKVNLDNGLTVIIHEDHKAPIVAVNIWYHVGSKNEPKGKNGFAHLFEHLMFQGSENFNDDFFKAMEKIGATDMNGTTNEDRTNYFENVPTTALDTALFLESDRMGHFVNAISQARLDEQRKVVLNEKRQGENQPYWGIAEEKISKGAFPSGHPYSWTTIGSDEDLNAASLTDVKEWFKKYYGPNNATLTIVGDVKTAEALEKVKKYFGDIPAGPRISRIKEWVAKRTETTAETVQDYVPFAKLIKVYNIPGVNSDELTKLDVASDILSSGKSSRLFKDIVYNQKLATDISANIWPGEIASLFVVDATAKEGVSLDELNNAIEKTMQSFFKQGPTSNELKRVKTQYLSGFIQSMEKIGGFGGKANLLASNQVFSNDPSNYRKKLDTRMNLTSNEVSAAARQWLSSGDYNLRITPFPKLTNTKQTLDRSTLPIPTSFPKATFPHIQEKTLSNGIRVLLAQRTHIPTVELSMQFSAGYSKDPIEKRGLGQLTFDLLNEGTTKNSLFQIEDKLSNLGSSLSSFSGMNLSGVYIKALKQNLEPTLDIFAEEILSPAFLEKELVRIKKETIEGIQQEKADPTGISGRLFSQLLYGKNHPYGAPLSGSGSEKSVMNISRKDIVDFYQTWAKPNNATVIAIGDISMEELTKSLEARFHSWQPSKLPSFLIPDIKTEQNRGTLFLVDRPNSPQTIIKAGHFFPSYNDPKQIPNSVLNLLLGGSFTSRINMNLREDKGWSYGARSTAVDLEGKRFWQVNAPVQTDKTDLAVKEIQNELTGISTQKKPITNDEFEKQKTFALLQLSGSWETNAGVYDPIKKLVYNEMDINFFETYSKKLEALTLSETISAANEVIHPNDLVWLLVGDKEKILPGLQKLGFSKIVLLDDEGNEKK